MTEETKRTAADPGNLEVNRTRVLIACLSDPRKGPRLRRIIQFCQSRGYAIDVLSPSPFKQDQNVGHIPIPPIVRWLPEKVSRNLGKVIGLILQVLSPTAELREKAIGFGHGFLKLDTSLRNRSYDLLVIEDLDLLPFAFSIRNNAKILVDAREYYPRQRENSLLFNLFQAPYRRQFCRDYLKRCDAVVTVSPGLIKQYKKEFGINAQLLRSVPEKCAISPSITPTDSVRIVHHGLANRNRQLEKMIKVFEKLDARFKMDFYLAGSSMVIEDLKKRAQGIEGLRILPPVKFEEIIPTLSKYDIGLFYVEPVTFNLKYCLPNKLFEFIQARLAVAIGPSPDMAEIVETYDCGFVSREFTVNSMADTLNGLTTDEINRAKAKSDKAAGELCFEVEQEKIHTIFDSLIKEETHPRS